MVSSFSCKIRNVHGQPNEYRKELIDAGLITKTNEECKELVKNFVYSVRIHENLENDITDSWTT